MTSPTTAPSTGATDTRDDFNEKYLSLPTTHGHKRTLAYTDSGNPRSRTIILYLHGAFTIGDASRPYPVFTNYLDPVSGERGLHFIAPTLSGWGNSSPREKGMSYREALIGDMTVLLETLHPGIGGKETSTQSSPASNPDDEPATGSQSQIYRLYISGGSFGTVPAQILFNAPPSLFPPARHIVGALVLGPIAPLRVCPSEVYARDMSWSRYIFIGPPSRYLPTRALFSLAKKLVLEKKLGTEKEALKYLQEEIFDKVEKDESERALFAEWRKRNGMEEGQLEREMARNVVKSVGNKEFGWEGAKEMVEVLHSDWGMTLNGNGVFDQKKLIFIVSSKGDTMAPASWASWLAEKYPGAKLKVLDSGGHIASIWSLESIWEELLKV